MIWTIVGLKDPEIIVEFEKIRDINALFTTEEEPLLSNKIKYVDHYKIVVRSYPTQYMENVPKF